MSFKSCTRRDSGWSVSPALFFGDGRLWPPYLSVILCGVFQAESLRLEFKASNWRKKRHLRLRVESSKGAASSIKPPARAEIHFDNTPRALPSASNSEIVSAQNDTQSRTMGGGVCSTFRYNNDGLLDLLYQRCRRFHPARKNEPGIL